MDGASFIDLVAQCAPLVHPITAHALVAVESSFNPHAIGIVGGALERQPRSADEAIATVHQLRRQGWNFSVGLAQINVHNFERLGLNPKTAFDPCQNLRAMQAVLGECYLRTRRGRPTQTALRQALSCYYSGNFVTGFDEGYVARVVAAASARPKPARPPP